MPGGGIKSLRKIQMGREGTAGTEVNASTVMWAEGTLEDKGVAQRLKGDVGIIGGTDATYIPMTGGEIVMEGALTFEQFTIPLEASVKTVTPTQDGVGSGYANTYARPTTAILTRKTYTIEGGDNQQAEIMLYSSCRKWNIKGSGRDGYTIQSTWNGRAVSNTTYTGSIAIPTVETALFGNTLLYIDAIGGTVGTTIQSTTLLGVDVTYESGIVGKNTADGRTDFSFDYASEDIVFSGKLTFEHDTIGVARKTDQRAQTARLFRLKIPGTALTTTGVYTTKLIQLDFPAKIMSVAKLGEQNGNDVLEVNFDSRYNGTAATAGTFLVVNELSAHP